MHWSTPWRAWAAVLPKAWEKVERYRNAAEACESLLEAQAGAA